MHEDGEVDCVQPPYDPRGRHSCRAQVGAAAGRPPAMYTPRKARWKPVAWTKGSGAAALWGDTAAGRRSIGGRHVLTDVHGVDMCGIG